MKILSILFLFTAFTACSQNHKTKKHIPNPNAKLLNDSAIVLAMQSAPENFDKAILLLDEATKIDSNYYAAFNSKLSFQLNLNRDSDALVTAKNMIRIMPESPTSHFITGLVFWKLQDGISAHNHFTKSTELFDKILAGMNKSDKKYDDALMNKAINLILIGQEEQGHDILKNLYNKQKDEVHKEMFGQFMYKSKKDILNSFLNPDSTVSESAPIIQD